MRTLLALGNGCQLQSRAPNDLRSLCEGRAGIPRGEMTRSADSLSASPRRLLSSNERVSPSGRFLSPHPCPLPWGEGESFAALVSDRFALNGRSATTANEAS